MIDRSRLAMAGGIAVGIALLAGDRLAKRRKELIILSQPMPTPAADVVDLIKQVELEPQFIPVISSVTVHDRTDCDVHYTVSAASRLPAVRYRKWWNEALPAVYWESEQELMGFHHAGSIYFTEQNGKSTAHLISEHWITAPVIGRIAAPFAVPVFRSEFEAWLKNLAEELGRRKKSG